MMLGKSLVLNDMESVVSNVLSLLLHCLFLLLLLLLVQLFRYGCVVNMLSINMSVSVEFFVGQLLLEVHKLMISHFINW